MMKNKMMRVASVLLVAVLLSTCAISGTFAKYVTSNDASDNARVAKFGVVIQADGSLYGTYYDTTFKPSTTSAAASLLVQSSFPATENVVAPGTQSDKGLHFSLTGTPEVRTKLDVTITCENIFLAAGKYAVMVPAPGVSATSWKEDTYYTVASAHGVDTYTVSESYVEGTTYYTMESVVELAGNYYPVVYKADKTDGTTTADSLEAIARDYINKLLTPETEIAKGTPVSSKYTYSGSKVYAPNFDYETLNANAETLTWAWAFDGVNDEADTILGQLQARGRVVKVGNTIATPTLHTDYYLQTSFNISISVTQVETLNGETTATEAPTQEPT